MICLLQIWLLDCERFAGLTVTAEPQPPPSTGLVSYQFPLTTGGAVSGVQEGIYGLVVPAPPEPVVVNIFVLTALLAI